MGLGCCLSTAAASRQFGRPGNLFVAPLARISRKCARKFELLTRIAKQSRMSVVAESLRQERNAAAQASSNDLPLPQQNSLCPPFSNTRVAPGISSAISLHDLRCVAQPQA